MLVETVQSTRGSLACAWTVRQYTAILINHSGHPTWAVLLLDDSSESNSFFDYFAPLLALDPDLDFVSSAGDLLGDSSVLRSALLILDTDEVAAAMASSTAPDGDEGPLGLIGRISADGTLEDLLALLAWAMDLMDQIGLTSAPPSE